MSRSWKERSCVYIVKAVDGFVPNSPWNWPETFTEGRLHVQNVTLTDARGTVRTFNKAAMCKREADVAAWDRQWAIACCCVRAKGWDRDRTVAVRQHDRSKSRRGFTTGEVERLLAACQQMRLPEVAGVMPWNWWHTFITIIVSTGLRHSEVMVIRRKDGAMLFPWPHSRQFLYSTFRDLLRAARIDPTGRCLFHCLRLTYYDRVMREGGAL